MAGTRLVVVGGGILGTLHCWVALARGWEVLHLERDVSPRGASVRNFGLVWVSGRAPGPELALALRARRQWERIAADCPGTGFRPVGSLTVARSAGELAVLEEAVARPDAAERSFRLLAPDEARRLNPPVEGPMLGALHCAADAALEPRRVLGALRAGCERTGRYRWHPGCEAVGLADHGVVTASGEQHVGDRVVLCPGAERGGLAGELLHGAPVSRVRLQMLETEPFAGEVTTSLADGDSLRYYPAFAGPARRALAPQGDVAARWAAQLLLVQRLDGALTIGDTHVSQEPFGFGVDDEPYRHLCGVAADLLGRPLPPLRQRWSGVYSQLLGSEDAVYLRRTLAPGVELVTGAGGRGMTLSPAIAEETLR